MSQTAAATAFDAWFAEMARWEGGYSNRAVDLGGETNRGITRTTFHALAEKLGIPNTYERFRALTVDDQRKFAKHYWDGVRGDDYDQGIAILMADMWWGGGAYQIGYAQRAINTRTYAGLTVDGVAGKKTAAAINSDPVPAKLFEAIALARRQAIADIVKNKPEQAANLTGWNNRMTAIEAVGRRWIGKKKLGRGTL